MLLAMSPHRLGLPRQYVYEDVSSKNVCLYALDFHRLTMVANWLNVGGVIACAILLLSFFVLPVKKTRRHYLTVCLITACGMMSVSIVGLIPSTAIADVSS